MTTSFAFAELFDFAGGFICPSKDPTELIKEYQYNIETRNELWEKFLLQNPDAEPHEKSNYIITGAIGYAGNEAECLLNTHDIEPDSIAKLSPNLRSFLENDYRHLNANYPSFVKYVLDPNGQVDIPSPLEQSRHSDSVFCRTGLQVAIKASNGQKICLKPETKEELQKRGLLTEFWPYNQLNNIRSLYKIESDKLYFIKYSLVGAELNKIAHNNTTNSVIIELKNSGIGLLAISIPREVLDSKFDFDNKQDIDFIILLDNEEVKFDEITNDAERTLFINFKSGAKQIEIIGTYPV